MVRTIKTVKKEDAAAMLANVPDDKVFWCHDSRVFKNLRELADGLTNMTEETFRHHVSGEKNDFVIWVRDVIKDEVTARNINKAINRTQSAKVVATRITALERSKSGITK